MSASVAPPVVLSAPRVEGGLTVAEFYALRDREVFAEARVELLDGRLHFEMAETLYHNAIVQLLLDLLREYRPEGFFAYSGARVEVDPENAPMPDVFVNRIPLNEVTLEDGEAKAGDVLLAIEVSLTSLAKDRGLKSAIYSGAGVPEYWIVDPRAQSVEVRREPGGGEYRSSRTYGAGETIRPLFSSGLEVEVARIFPKGPAA